MRIHKNISDFDFHNIAKSGINIFTVVAAEDQYIDENNSLLNLKLEVEQNGHTAIVKDSIANDDFLKIEKFSSAIGLKHVFESGEINITDCIGKKGQVRLFHKQDTSKEEDVDYNAFVNGYIPSEA